MLQDFDPDNGSHLARQLVLVAKFGEHLSSPTRTDKLSDNSQQILFDILTVLEAYAAELTRLLTGGKQDSGHGKRASHAAGICTRLILAMLTAKPELQGYDPNTTPANLGEVTLNFLAHSLIALTDVSATSTSISTSAQHCRVTNNVTDQRNRNSCSTSKSTTHH